MILMALLNEQAHRRGTLPMRASRDCLPNASVFGRKLVEDQSSSKALGRKGELECRYMKVHRFPDAPK